MKFYVAEQQQFEWIFLKAILWLLKVFKAKWEDAEKSLLPTQKIITYGS